MEKNIQDAELEALLEYDSAEEFSDTDRLTNFMKKYAAIKGHRVRIGGEERVDKITQEITKRIYLCCQLSPNYQKDKLHLAKLNVYGE
ncbi:hypothetical protein RhiirC2_802834 [Rhizophagus irregularis]|uniref:Uncharacterized protein n=1 Tax=Rhizophagus irregularis TaxID=588596 RepID=A0A2N1M0V2_9GLOM|nr:hypothetical protein RhiirC2_802834 [Rhizophagus irregularis]